MKEYIEYDSAGHPHKVHEPEPVASPQATAFSVNNSLERERFPIGQQWNAEAAAQPAAGTTPCKFRKKPVVIEAFRLGMDGIPDWFMDKVSLNAIILRGEYRDLRSCEINTLEGVMEGKKGDWIIQGVKGEIYPCKSDIFEATYEPAE